MAERKAQNKWYPSDFDYKKHGSANGYQKSHHLRERARKIKDGILIIRFEMPFNVWCLGCNNHIGMGVRYNAEKSKVGDYFSTKIYQFKMKCHLCDNHFILKTDPKNLDYTVESGARRQNKKWQATDEGHIEINDKEKNLKLATDSMFKLEHIAEDKNKLLKSVPILDKIKKQQDDRFKDDYASNQLLRKIFRVERNKLENKFKNDEKILKKCAINLVMIDEEKNDTELTKIMKIKNKIDTKRKNTLNSSINKKSNKKINVKLTKSNFSEDKKIVKLKNKNIISNSNVNSEDKSCFSKSLVADYSDEE